MSTHKSSLSISLRGGIYSVINAIVALLVFAIIDEVVRVIGNPLLSFDLSSVGLTFTVGLIFSILPVFVGGAFLMNIFYRYALNNTISMLRAIIFGSVMGAVIVLAISAVVSALALSTGKVPPTRLVLPIIEALIPGILAGGWTGKQLLGWLKDN